ncbi:MAG TPA: glutaredoxin family protein [candidate division Zixibacteria bacterium]|nr:glutaredoxin family protein [candidate division Zixibacteria bacterium]
MKNEKLYIYYFSAQKEQAELLLSQIQTFGFDAESVNLETQETERKLVNGLIEKSDNPFPILRIGEQKIKAMFQNPKLKLLQKIFSSDSENHALPHATIYSTATCGDCRQLKMWMDSQKIPYTEILIENSEKLKEQITRWSGGRRVVPTVEYESIGRLFNPGIAVFQKLYT